MSASPDDIRKAFPGVTMIQHGRWCDLVLDPLKNCTCGAQRRVDRKVMEQMPPSLLTDAAKFKTRMRLLAEEVHTIAGDAVISGKLDRIGLERACAGLHALVRDFEKKARKADDRQLTLFSIPKGKKGRK